MTELKLGTYYHYMIADATGYKWAKSPTQSSDMPLHLGLGVEVPKNVFMHAGKSFEVRHVFGTDDPHNPFHVPLVVASRADRNGSRVHG